MGPKTQRVYETIRSWIESGRYAPGDKLPSERTLSAELEIGRTALRQVLARLASERLIRAYDRSSYRIVGGSNVPVPGEMESWKIHGSRRIYENRWVNLDLVDVEPPGVERFEHHVVRLFRVAITAVVDEQDRVLMLWRYRFVPEQWGWELPGGIVDAGEDAAVTAARETEEETGWRPTSVEHVVTYQPMIGMVDSPHEIFVARGATKVGEPTDAEEAGHVAWIPLDEISALMADGKLMGSGTLVALLHLLSSRPIAGR
ncbi:GntR family transcriptional regulator [Streptomyces sp. RerS4]|uniref:GntR family transcriptional regulator n=1 Tax=Streptomyces sp. RerS4 TaxID=2942449 RepID=UPI00201C43A4|nr:GntR family transcriptional regulator [Streptomyces sp. RerS4]UQX00896.1 GntR family transcriptional regulator [Streptomyces sp. RerS4]